MKVKELIEQLRSFNPDLEVSVTGHEGSITDDFTVTLLGVKLNPEYHTASLFYGEHDVIIQDSEADGIRVVIS